MVDDIIYSASQQDIEDHVVRHDGFDGIQWNEEILRIHDACTLFRLGLVTIITSGHLLRTARVLGANQTARRRRRSGRVTRTVVAVCPVPNVPKPVAAGNTIDAMARTGIEARAKRVPLADWVVDPADKLCATTVV